MESNSPTPATASIPTSGSGSGFNSNSNQANVVARITQRIGEALNLPPNSIPNQQITPSAAAASQQHDLRPLTLLSPAETSKLFRQQQQQQQRAAAAGATAIMSAGGGGGATHPSNPAASLLSNGGNQGFHPGDGGDPTLGSSGSLPKPSGGGRTGGSGAVRNSLPTQQQQSQAPPPTPFSGLRDEDLQLLVAVVTRLESMEQEANLLKRSILHLIIRNQPRESAGLSLPMGGSNGNNVGGGGEGGGNEGHHPHQTFAPQQSAVDERIDAPGFDQSLYSLWSNPSAH